MSTEPELVRKILNVVPERLLERGFTFEFAGWEEAVSDLATRPAGTAGKAW